MEGGHDAVTCELSLARDPQPEKAAATDHEKVHQCTVMQRNERLPLVSDIMARIGAPYGWLSSRRSPQEWAAWFAEHPGRTCWLLTLDDEPVGVVCYDPHPGAEVEIKTFGLVPEFTGKGHC
jgi:RimJ/RimL family protein N-acetyltransferase